MEKKGEERVTHEYLWYYKSLNYDCGNNHMNTQAIVPHRTQFIRTHANETGETSVRWTVSASSLQDHIIQFYKMSRKTDGNVTGSVQTCSLQLPQYFTGNYRP